MSRVLLIALLGAGLSLAAPVTWTLQNVTFTDGGTATGSFVYDASTGIVSSYSISVAGGNTETFPTFTYQNGTLHNSGASAVPQDGVIDFDTDIVSYGESRLLALPVLPLPSTGGTVSLNLANDYGAECYDCNPYRLFASGQVVANVTSPNTATAPALSPWALGLVAILLIGLSAILLPRTSVTR